MLNGICYQPFPRPYDPSTANTTCIFFGSDIAYDPMAPLWGSSYTSSMGSSCGTSGAACRNDLETLVSMGVNLVRLYDWDPRNNHWNFLDACQRHGIKVLVPVSNYFLIPGQGFPNRETLIPELIASFGNKQRGATDYHPAIEAIIIGNEPELNGFGASECVQFTSDWMRIEAKQFSGWSPVKLGHPVDFGTYRGRLPCWGFWDPLTQGLSSAAQRLILCPQTYNDEGYLYVDTGGGAGGYVQQTWSRYQLPILFTEIGQSRMSPNATSVVDGQLSGSIRYAASNPGRLLATCFFQFADKVWLPGTSEGSFGAFEHSGSTLCTIEYSGKDFTHWENDCDSDKLAVDKLAPSSLYSIVVKNYGK